MSNSVADMCRRFAMQHITYWRSAKKQGLPQSVARNRAIALYWLAQMRGHS